MKKVVRIITRLNIGGPAINTVLLSEGLQRCDFQSRLVAGMIDKYEADMSYFAAENNVEPLIVKELSRNINLLKDFRALCKIYGIIRKEKPDIVHTHTAKAGTLGRVAAVLAGVPVRIHTFHGHVFDGYFNGPATRIFLIIEKILAKFTDKIIAVSDSVANDIHSVYRIAPNSKISVIRLGFKLGKFLESGRYKGELKKSLGLSDTTALIGIVGRLAPIKNHKMFLDAARFLKTAHPEAGVKFVIVGDGQLQSQTRLYAKDIGIMDDVLFLGWQRDLEKIYADLDIVCLTSINEGTPVSIIEAMAAGRPVVATDVGGVKDIVKPGVNGILVPSGDAVSFGAALADLLKDSARRVNMGNNGREFVKKNFNEDRLIEDTKNLYEGLLEKKGILK